MKLAFKNARSMDPPALLELEPLHRSQLLEALRMYCSASWATVPEALDGFEKQFGFPLEIHLWDVIDAYTGDPLYEFWVQGAGDGTLFEYGTDESPNSIGSTQHSFQAAGDDHDESRPLLDALQAAAEAAGV
jgi:hypothetical protein